MQTIFQVNNHEQERFETLFNAMTFANLKYEKGTTCTIRRGVIDSKGIVTLYDETKYTTR